MSQPTKTSSESQSPQPASLWQVIKSVSASMFGVQSSKNHHSDFQQPSFVPYLIVGIGFVLLFIAALVIVVNLVLP